MEARKSSRADLESKRRLFLQIGLVISLLFVLYAFNSASPVRQTALPERTTDGVVPEELIPVTRAEAPRIPPPPPPAVVEQLTIIDNSALAEGSLEILDSEADKTSKIEIGQIAPPREEPVAEDPIFVVAEVMPQFPGGESSLRKYLSGATHYPAMASETGIQGVVYVNFIIGVDGMVTQARIVRGVDPLLDQEALRVVSSLPRWKPGLQNNRPVRVSYTVPISFRLQ